MWKWFLWVKHFWVLRCILLLQFSVCFLFSVLVWVAHTVTQQLFTPSKNTPPAPSSFWGSRKKEQLIRLAFCCLIKKSDKKSLSSPLSHFKCGHSSAKCMFVNVNSSLSISWWVLAGSGSSRDPTKETQVTRDPLFLQPPLRLARQGRLLWSGLVLSRVQSVCWWGSGGKGGRSGSFRLPCSDSSMTGRYHISRLQRHTGAIMCGHHRFQHHFEPDVGDKCNHERLGFYWVWVSGCKIQMKTCCESQNMSGL